MRKAFPGYYLPSDDEFSVLWENCLFVLDTNVLIHLWENPEKDTSRALLEVLESVADRLWLPHQAALEYLNHRLEERVRARDNQSFAQQSLSQVCGMLDRCCEKCKGGPDKDLIKEVLRKVKPVLDDALETLDKRKPGDPFDYNEAEDRIAALFDGKVGHPYPFTRLHQIYDEGRVRYAAKIPPGYGDEGKKDGVRTFGDLVLWFQVIDRAKETCKPIILVTDDKKDWLLRCTAGDRRILGPRPEIVNEMATKARVQCYVYTEPQFLETAKRRGLVPIPDEVLKQSREEFARETQRRFASTSLSSYLRNIEAIKQIIGDQLSPLDAIASSVRKGYLEAFQPAAYSMADLLRPSLDSFALLAKQLEEDRARQNRLMWEALQSAIYPDFDPLASMQAALRQMGFSDGYPALPVEDSGDRDASDEPSDGAEGDPDTPSVDNGEQSDE